MDTPAAHVHLRCGGQ